MGALGAVIGNKAEVAPIDSYALALLTKHAPELTAQVRVIKSTEPTAIPAFFPGQAPAGVADVSGGRRRGVAMPDGPTLLQLASPRGGGRPCALRQVLDHAGAWRAAIPWRRKPIRCSLPNSTDADHSRRRRSRHRVEPCVTPGPADRGPSRGHSRSRPRSRRRRGA
jgi:hypothetical protein